ncbi:MAG: hypothetical protein J6W29_01925, partial [Neisseriaceae bacterium]|nr:hypothetical protein [Neisseriaceae bacterium]
MESGDASETSPVIKDAGTQKIYYYVIATQTDSDEKTLISGSDVVEIRKASLTVTAKEARGRVGYVPVGSGVTYSGFVAGEDESVLGGELSYNSNYGIGDPAGFYEITPYGYESDNYEITYMPGILEMYDTETTTVVNDDGTTTTTTTNTSPDGTHSETVSVTKDSNGKLVETTTT